MYIPLCSSSAGYGCVRRFGGWITDRNPDTVRGVGTTKMHKAHRKATTTALFQCGELNM